MAETTQPEHLCKNCGSADLVMKYGRIYYLACKSCSVNTAVKMTAGSKLRKAGNLFYMVDASGGETIYFMNS